MRHVPTIFLRDPATGRVTEEVNPAAAWVFDALPGVFAHRLVSGACLMYGWPTDEDSMTNPPRWWVRTKIREGEHVPAIFHQMDEHNGTRYGWMPAISSTLRAQVEEAVVDGFYDPGTYELIGPRIGDNPYQVSTHMAVEHEKLPIVRPFSMTFEGIRDTCLQVLKPMGWDGLVWHHLDGYRAKIKVGDFE